jgi:hypothetical protein
MMKKRHGWKRVEAYTDESGHTGLNLFDSSQPWFWTGTLVSAVPLQQRGDALLHRLCTSVGEQILHANKLGLAKIESIASPLNEFLEEIDARFVFTAIEKRHLASGKLADTVLDSTMNQGVSTLHYGIHGFRILLSRAIVELVSPRDQEEFWTVYATADAKGLSGILSRLLVRVSAIPGMDKRLREILSDALTWGARHPQELLDFQRSELDAPNLVALGLLMGGLHEILEKTGFKVGRFVHDQQRQFGQFMREWYDMGRRFIMPTHLTARITDLQEIDTYDCKIEIVPSRGVVGLQVIDVVLWLYKRAISDPMKNYPGCAALVEFVDDHGEIRYHSRAQLNSDADRVYRDIMALPIDAERLKRGKDMAKEYERAKKQRMTD